MTAAITGLALICPVGWSADATYYAWLEGRCAGNDGGLPPPMHRVPLARLDSTARLAVAEARWTDRSAALAVLAAEDALADAGIDAARMQRPESAVVVGTSKAGALTALAGADSIRRGDADGTAVGRLWPWGTPGCAAAALMRRYRLGGEVTTIAAACATGLAALDRGAAIIADGRADCVLVVATDASIHPLFAGAFWNMGALAQWDAAPDDACRPFAADRCGFVLSEGAAAVVLQPDPAGDINQYSGTVIVGGTAVGSQADHLVRPGNTSAALASIVQLACRNAGWTDRRADLVHAHGTGTVFGDAAETAAIHLAFGDAADDTVVVSTKPITGHMLGAAGLAQAVLTVRAMQAGCIGPTANLRRPDAGCDLDYNANGPRKLDIGRAVCMANGFGGTSVAAALERPR